MCVCRHSLSFLDETKKSLPVLNCLLLNVIFDYVNRGGVVRWFTSSAKCNSILFLRASNMKILGIDSTICHVSPSALSRGFSNNYGKILYEGSLHIMYCAFSVKQ